MPSECEVLVVGSGPVGLMAAGELSRRGVSVRIIDQAPQRSPQSRALVVHARTLEILDLAGLADAFVKQGYPSPGLDVGLDGAHRRVSVDMRVLDSRYPFMLVLPQRQTEQILADALKGHGVETEWSTKLVGIEQTGADVVATVGTDEGTEQVHARYVVGCDGAHSTVRRLVNLSFDGDQLDELVLIGDVKVDHTFVRSRITNFTSPRGFVSILPFLGEYVRVFAVDFAQQGHDRSDKLTLDELQNTVNAIAPQSVSLTEPTWLTRYVAPSRQASAIRAGRVFLAGDAAHAHSPAGGQGMNTGLQDAANLGWKLAMVLRGGADARLLATYHEERHPVHAQVRRTTDRMFRTFVLRNRVLQLARGVVTTVAIPRGPVQRRLAGKLSGIEIGYRRTAAPQGVPRHGLRAGDRVPDMELWTAHRGLVRLYELLRGPGYTLLVYATADAVNTDRARIINLLRAQRDDWTQRCLVMDEGVMDESALNAAVFVDVKGEFPAKMGTVHGSVLLTRPDGYVRSHEVVQ